jgi:tetratricopeptide (TPR) repeat protein
MKDTTKKILIIIALGFLVFSLSLKNGFVWDDEEQIINNTVIHSISNWPKFFAGGAFNSGGTGSLLGVYYKPLMTLSFSIIYSLFGANPTPFHLLSLTLHISNTILVFLIFDKFFRKKKYVPLTLALIFLVHALTSEVVFYAANLQDALFFFFGLSALYISTFDLTAVKKYILIFLLLTASLLSKETGIIFVGAVILYTFSFDAKRIKSSIFTSTGVLGIYAFLRFVIANVGFGKIDLAPLSSQNLDIRLLNLPKIAIYYFQNLIYPANLVPNQHWFITTANFSGFWLPAIISIIIIIVIAIPVFRTNKVYTFFLAIFLTSLAMHLQIIPLDATVSGRWFYLPMFGLLGMLGTVIPKIDRKILVGIIIIITILSVRTFVRSLDWKDGLTLYSHDAAILPNDFNLENNLGVELWRIGKIDEAGIHFQASVNLAPSWWTNWNNLGAYRQSLGDLTGAEVDYKKAIDNGNYYLAYENYAGILIKEGKTKEAEDFLENNALKYFPENQNLEEMHQYLLQNK